MNILIPYSWIKDYFSTNLPAARAAEGLSLHSFSVEKIKKEKGDYVFEIEITPNRGDALSVLGISRELQAVFPGKTKERKILPLKTRDRDSLKVEIKDKNLVPRFSAVVLDNVKIKESPKIIKERLVKAGIRPINNVVDITNYLMIDRGQPMHAFDYDKIKGKKMTIEESKKGEKIKTLDDVERTLPEGVIIIKDGEKRIIDLCGIMGAKNSEVDKKTKKVLLFVQIYDPRRIRKASMLLGHRTDAALRFEKGVDFEGVLPSLRLAVQMIKENAEGEVSSNLIDIKSEAPKTKEIILDYKRIREIAGIEVRKERIDGILKNLGFKLKGKKAVPPSWRLGDIENIEDLAEEVLRIYGYHNLPSVLFKGDIPEKKESAIFRFEDSAKDFLKYRGFYECYNYTLTRKENVSSDALEVINPLAGDFAFLRTSLVPQLKDVIKKNKERKERIMVFEISNVFIPSKKGLPEQPVMLGVATRGVEFLSFKGIIESLFEDIGVEDTSFEIKKEGDILTTEINFEKAASSAKRSKKYIPVSKFSPIKEDLTFSIPENVLYPELKKNILLSDKRIERVEFKYIYENFLTVSVSYLDRKKQISSKEAGEIREKIFQRLEKTLKVKLKT